MIVKGWEEVPNTCLEHRCTFSLRPHQTCPYSVSECEAAGCVNFDSLRVFTLRSHVTPREVSGIEPEAPEGLRTAPAAALGGANESVTLVFRQYGGSLTLRYLDCDRVSVTGSYAPEFGSLSGSVVYSRQKTGANWLPGASARGGSR